MKTRKGMASLYLVAFTTLLLGIVTMSFARVMISESKQASNSDLSESAFDSALAGIEDAKTVIVMYEYCLNNPTGEVGGINCGYVKGQMNAAFTNGNCDVIQKILGNGETVGEANSEAAGEVPVGENSNQYYTCVPISNDSPTYRAVLNEGTRSKVIPAKISDGKYAEVKGIELQWFTPASDDSTRYMFTDTDKNEINFIPFKNKDAAMDGIGEKAAPILSFEIFQTDTDFTMAELDLNNEDNTGTNHAMIILYPDYSKKGDAVTVNGHTPGTFVSAQDLLDASNKSNQAALNATANYNNSVVPKMVTCGYADGGARCRATIEFPPTYGGGSRAEQTFMFRVSLPYGVPETDFTIQPCTKIDTAGDGVRYCSETVGFTGAQYIVDSTGRASTLYRRIIARIETSPAPIFPEYAVQVSGDNAVMEKNFWVTENCWSTDGQGGATGCANNGKVN